MQKLVFNKRNIQEFLKVVMDYTEIEIEGLKKDSEFNYSFSL